MGTQRPIHHPPTNFYPQAHQRPITPHDRLSTNPLSRLGVWKKSGSSSSFQHLLQLQGKGMDPQFPICEFSTLVYRTKVGRALEPFFFPWEKGVMRTVFQLAEVSVAFLSGCLGVESWRLRLSHSDTRLSFSLSTRTHRRERKRERALDPNLFLRKLKFPQPLLIYPLEWERSPYGQIQGTNVPAQQFYSRKSTSQMGNLKSVPLYEPHSSPLQLYSPLEHNSHVNRSICLDFGQNRHSMREFRTEWDSQRSEPKCYSKNFSLSLFPSRKSLNESKYVHRLGTAVIGWWVLNSLSNYLEKKSGFTTWFSFPRRLIGKKKEGTKWAHLFLQLHFRLSVSSTFHRESGWVQALSPETTQNSVSDSPNSSKISFQSNRLFQWQTTIAISTPFT